jgi:thioredoxin-like negative regulator of GroEL
VPDVALAPPPASPPARQARTGPNVYRPPAPSSASSNAQANSRARTGRRGPVGAVEARAQQSNLGRRLVVPGLVLVLLALVAGGTALWRRRPDPEVLRLAAEASARLTQDDAGSLARSIQLYDALLARAPARLDAVAGRALARVLLGAAQQEEAEPFAEQLAGRTAERERLLLETPVGAEDTLRLLAVESTRLEGELAPRRKLAEGLLAQAAGELKAVANGPGGEQVAVQGLMVLAALAGDRDETARLAALARSRAADPWADLAEAWLEVKAPGGREPALPALARLVGEHPELLRARYLLARAQAAGGHREEAVATLTGLLAANPRHERAQRLKVQLTAPPAPPPQVHLAPAPPPPPPRRWPAAVATPTPALPPPPSSPPTAPAGDAAPSGPAKAPPAEIPLQAPIRIVVPPPTQPPQRREVIETQPPGGGAG